MEDEETRHISADTPDAAIAQVCVAMMKTSGVPLPAIISALGVVLVDAISAMTDKESVQKQDSTLKQITDAMCERHAIWQMRKKNGVSH